jgi:hypothetical protein
MHFRRRSEAASLENALDRLNLAHVRQEMAQEVLDAVP